MPLQTRKEGRVAKHETAEECSLILKKVLKKALQLKEQHGVWAERDLYISHDKASYFTACKKPDGEGEVYQLVTMPTHSPDLHQLVEHSIARSSGTSRRATPSWQGRWATAGPCRCWRSA